VVFAACCRLSSLACPCARLLLAPSRETLRQALFANLPALAELERCLNRALAADLPRARNDMATAFVVLYNRLFLRSEHGDAPCQTTTIRSASG
jgi:hypothetical protein